MTRKLVILLLFGSIIVHGYLVWKSRRIPTKTSSKYSYLSNTQYAEQTKIFNAYTAPCNIALIGDSHIYKCHWSELLGTIACNRGIGSDNSEGVFKRIDEIIRAKPKICFISAGSNDIDLNTHPDTTVHYIHLIVSALNRSGIRPVVMELTSVAPGYPNKDFNKKASELNKRLRDMAETISITIEPADLQEDGIHLTASGYEKWKDAINQFLAVSGP
jgi:hypothetical protein